MIVAVVDTGVDYNHPDIAANIWTNPGEIPNDGIDDDHNGYIDDVIGWDFIGSTYTNPRKATILSTTSATARTLPARSPPWA